MICPNCNSNIPDDSIVCPACRSSLSRVQLTRNTEASYCKSCGAYIPVGAESCPSCGLPASLGSHMKPKNPMMDLPDPKSDLEETQSFARIESAVPNIPEQGDIPRETSSSDTGTRAILIAALAALLVVGSITLVITHPWDPDAYSIKATTAADTSKAGFPGTIDALAGQDSQRPSETETLSGDDATYQSLHDAWEKLGSLSQKLNENETVFWEEGFSDDVDRRSEVKSDADVLAIELSNLISSINQIDVSSGTYADDKEQLIKLGNWLRNRADALTQAWGLNLRMDDEGLTRETVAQPLLANANEDGRNAYGVMFENEYATSEPEQK